MRDLKVSSTIKILENVMSFNWSYLTIKPVIIDLSFLTVTEILIGFINLNKFLLTLFTVIKVFRMKFDCQPSVGIFYFIQSCISWNPQHLITSLSPLREVFVEKLMFFFIYKVIFIKKAFKCFIGIIQCISFM